jgi:hypothetical protein
MAADAIGGWVTKRPTTRRKDWAASVRKGQKGESL